MVLKPTILTSNSFFLPHTMSTLKTLSSTQTSPLITFTNFNPIKLTRDKYPLWLSQIVSHFRGENLFGYVDGTTPPTAYCLFHH